MDQEVEGLAISLEILRFMKNWKRNLHLFTRRIEHFSLLHVTSQMIQLFTLLESVFRVSINFY